MAKIRRKLTQADVDKIMLMNEACGTYFQRDPDRADAIFVKPRRRQPIEVSRAKARLRTARWRSEMDRRRAPTVEQVGMALAVALATTSWQDRLTGADYDLIRRALMDLEARGFSIAEARKTLRRLRIKLVDPGDRQGEESEGCGPPVWQDEKHKLPF
ncbi:hypothetical protein SAMN05216338_106313 [Bradyrhizobium sp. Rc2d]|uniref:hypothetical protein n=1 Tax=Bradyrhizobium sp. Rc2d TaxID=1855321 RepID=UPI000883A1B9|nr:hypothetical protein [Bradyrhizobium sp. Rc2d]SDJ74138.1 hypothetical protein SAMN05216338_106313 [Bradyrhizobium sp. Rc2d]